MSGMTVLVGGGSEATLPIGFDFKVEISCFRETLKGGGGGGGIRS